MSVTLLCRPTICYVYIWTCLSEINIYIYITTWVHTKVVDTNQEKKRWEAGILKTSGKIIGIMRKSSQAQNSIQQWAVGMVRTWAKCNITLKLGVQEHPGKIKLNYMFGIRTSMNPGKNTNKNVYAVN